MYHLLPPLIHTFIQRRDGRAELIALCFNSLDERVRMYAYYVTALYI